jgi:orotate phosphoribosyltransferase
LQVRAAHERLLHILRAQAVMRGEFILSSGHRSDYYIDARLVTLSGEGAWLVGHVLLDAISRTSAEAVAGLAIGADPVVASIVTVAGSLGRPFGGLIVRKERKEHGAARRIEGPWRSGMTVAVVDDTVTTGASPLEAARAVEEAGGVVAGVFALIDREQGARAAVERAGYRFLALFTARQLLQAGDASGD